MSPWLDHEREELTIKSVRPESGGGFSVTFEDGMSFWVQKEYDCTPEVGDKAVLWGRGMGYAVRGLAVAGRVLYYRTDAEQKAKEQQDIDERHAQKLADYESKRSDYDKRVAALPDPLRLRIEGFRDFAGDGWRWEYEPYELASCEEAARLVKHFADPDALVFFSKLDYADQKQEYPEMDDGHSGNTWGNALRFAHATLTRPEIVPQMHAAICPLVGCESAGCYAARKEAD